MKKFVFKKYVSFFFFVLAIAITGLNFCPATCMAFNEECHMSSEVVQSQCHAEAESSEACQCLHQERAVIQKLDVDFQVSFQHLFLHNLHQKDLVFCSEVKFSAEKRIYSRNDLAPPGHYLSSLIAYLSQTHRAPPFLV